MFKPSAPPRGALSISLTPFDSASSNAACTSGTANAMWWIPSPFFSINLAIVLSSLVGSSNSILVWPTLKNADVYKRQQLGSIISLKEPFLSRGCRMSVDPDAYYNPDAVAIRIEQPLQMPDGGDLKIVPSPVRDPLEMMAPGADPEPAKERSSSHPRPASAKVARSGRCV